MKETVPLKTRTGGGSSPAINIYSPVYRNMDGALHSWENSAITMETVDTIDSVYPHVMEELGTEPQ